MTLTRNTGTHGDATGAQSSEKLVASIGGPATLTRCTIRGIISVKIASVTLTAGGYSTLDITGGLQYGTIGFTPSPITDGTATAGNYVSFGEICTFASAAVTAAGSSPQTVTDSTFYALDFNWRGCFPIPADYDFYFSIGMDNGKSYSIDFESYYSWSLESATFP